MSGEAEVGLEQLKLLKKAFDDADDDGSGELDIDEFVEQLGPYLGKGLTHEQICQLFMKIDADAGGTVDWDEFSNYMFLKRAESDGDDLESWRFFATEQCGTSTNATWHSDYVDAMRFSPALGRYITCGKDGTVRIWSASDLKHVRTIINGTQWVTDACFVPSMRKLCVTAMDRSITFYDVNRGAYDMAGRLHGTGSMGAPSCCDVIQLHGSEHVMYGDSVGAVNMLLVDTSEPFQARDLLHTDHTRDFVCLHGKHSDWISKVQHIEDVGLVTASLDSKILVFDIDREGVMREVRHHPKGVRDFAYCRPYNLFASCGGRDVVLWGAQTGRTISELIGHTATVHSIVVDDSQCQVVSLSCDNIVKVWDLRNNKCIQTIGRDDWRRAEDRQPSALLYDGLHKRLVTAHRKPCVWDHKLVVQDRNVHRFPVVQAIYNSAFFVVVSADESGCIMSWNVLTGVREGRFFNAHGDSKLTAIAFDANQRRMVSAGNDGAVKMWNFNNGSLLRLYKHEHTAKEISKVTYIMDEKRQSECIYAAGWNRSVFIWEDEDEDVVEDCREMTGHGEDILAMDACQARHVLATGDYEGRIIVWDMDSGERRTSLYHRADRYENSVEALLWIPVDDASTSSDPVVLVSAGGDGVLRVWKVALQGVLMCTLPGALGHLEVVRDLAADSKYERFLACDSAGHIRVWDIEELTVAALHSPQACMDAFKQVSHTRVCDGGVNSVRCARVESASYILAGCADCNVRLLTMDGALVGTFGVHSWVITDPSTFQNARGNADLSLVDKWADLYDMVEVYSTATGEKAQAPEVDAKPWDGSSLSDFYFRQRREKMKRDLIARPGEAVHSHLAVAPAQDLPSSVSAIMDRASYKKTGARMCL